METVEDGVTTSVAGVGAGTATTVKVDREAASNIFLVIIMGVM